MTTMMMNEAIVGSPAKPIGLAGDHASYELKLQLIKLFEESNIEYIDFGTYSNESVDYADFGHKLACVIESGSCDYGIAICGSGNGINITVNKHSVVRGALCWNIEIARLAREHNDANILTLPARFISTLEALDIVNVFFNTCFEGGRHKIRIDKIKI